MDRVGPLYLVFIGCQRPPGSLVAGPVVAGVPALLHVQRQRKNGTENDDSSDRQVHAQVLVAEHGPRGADLGGVEAQERQDQDGGDRHRGHRGVLLHRYGGSSDRAGQLTCK